MTEEERTLETIAIFHFILGAVTAIFSSIPFIHFFIGIAMLNPTFAGSEPAPRLFALAFIVLSILIIIGGWTFSILIVVTGLRLRQRRSLTFCQVIAFLECLIVPLGTILGIFTILTLQKTGVKELFTGGGRDSK